MPHACYRCNVVLTVFGAVFLVALSAHSGDKEPRPFGQEEWPSYGADTANSKYASLDQIHKDNVKELQIAWRWSSGHPASRSNCMRRETFRRNV